MKNKNPPFEITNEMVALIGKISEATGRINILQPHPNPVLRKSNRIRTVHGSLAIEQNTLSLEQVTAVLDGKRVIAPPRDITEVKNTFEIYDNMALLDPYSMNDLLKAHGVMMRGLMDHPGSFRTKPAGVADQHGSIIHFGTLPQYVPGLVSDLMVWTEMSDAHPLIKSCVFHYEFELIHPFLDGNGRLGRLWHTLLLSRWNSVFAWLPIESIIHDRQNEYYNAINASNNAAESTVFIEFMLSAILEALNEADGFEKMTDKESLRWSKIYGYLQNHDHIMNSHVRELLGVSSATANRILTAFAEKGLLEKRRIKSHWGYILK